jgi:hypothetical protein
MSGSTPHHVNITWTSCNRFLVSVFDKINRTTRKNSLLEGGGDVTDVTVRNQLSNIGVSNNILALEFPIVS